MGLVLSICSSVAAIGTPIFVEDFSSGLGDWVGKNSGGHHGIVVTDPLDPANEVLSFSRLNVSGDIFTSALLPVGGYSELLIEFDYLGLAKPASVPDNFGGFLGISVDLNPGVGAWLAGTDQSAANGLGFNGIHLVDDGQWHRYTIDIAPILSANGIPQVHLMIEDWLDAGGEAGDAYFDNLTVTGRNVPDTGGTGTLLLVAFAALAFRLTPVGLNVIPEERDPARREWFASRNTGKKDRKRISLC